MRPNTVWPNRMPVINSPRTNGCLSLPASSAMPRAVNNVTNSATKNAFESLCGSAPEKVGGEVLPVGDIVVMYARGRKAGAAESAARQASRGGPRGRG